MEKYKVKTEVFDGPLELLLALVEDRKFFINEISLAVVTDDYLNYVKSLQERGVMDMMELTGFIVVAATLILIKSKSLLPGLRLTGDEQGQIDDLELRLKFYQAIKGVTPLIKEQFGRNIIFSSLESSHQQAIFAPDQSLTISRMLEMIHDVIDNIPQKESLPEISVKKVISIEEMINSLTDRIQDSLRFSFNDISKGKKFEDKKEEKVYVIVSFLAMLEMVRSGIADVIQGANFEDIEVLQYKEEIITT